MLTDTSPAALGLGVGEDGERDAERLGLLSQPGRHVLEHVGVPVPLGAVPGGKGTHLYLTGHRVEVGARPTFIAPGDKLPHGVDLVICPRVTAYTGTRGLKK